MHWMDWDIVMPRFAELLLEGAYLAGVGTTMIPGPWTLLGEMLSRYRTDRYIAQPHDVQEQHLFQVVGKQATGTISFVQSVDDVVASYHSRVGFSRERMGSVQAAAFDQEAKETLLKAYPSGMVPFQLRGHVVWGFLKEKEELLFSQPAEMRHRQDIPPDIPDVKRFTQSNAHECSCRRANAYIGGQNPLGRAFTKSSKRDTEFIGLMSERERTH